MENQANHKSISQMLPSTKNDKEILIRVTAFYENHMGIIKIKDNHSSQLKEEAYPEPCQTSKMELFAKMYFAVAVTIFIKIPFLDNLTGF